MDINESTILNDSQLNDNYCALNDVFDKIYIIHCAENTERMKNIEYQIKKNKLNAEIFWACYHPYSYICINSLLLANKANHADNGSEFNLTRNFYTIIKTSYLRGFERILIFEDDFSLLKNEVLNDFIEHIPEDFDIIQFSQLFKKDIYDSEDLQNEYENGNYFIKAPFGAWSNNGLALSRKGMKYFIDRIDNEFMAADYPIFESTNKYDFYGKTLKSNVNHYFPTVPIVYLDKRFDSQVQQEDKKELYELYDNLNKDFYNLIYK